MTSTPSTFDADAETDAHTRTDVDRSPNGRNGREDRRRSDAERREPTLDDLTTDARTRTPLGALAVLASTAAFYRLVGLAGVLAGIVLAVCWYRLSAEATFAFASVVLAVVVPENPPLDRVVFVEGGLLALLVSTARRYDAPVRLLGAFLVFLGGLLAVTWLGVERGGAIWVGALVLALAVSLLAYGQHRYALVRMGLVESEDREAAR